MSKSKGGVDNKKWEGVGDAILKLVVSEYLHTLPKTINHYTPIQYFTSNVFLASIRHTVPIKVRSIPNNCIPGSKNSMSRVGDEVEYYIAFLYFNYGIDSARRFVLSKLSVYIKK